MDPRHLFAAYVQLASLLNSSWGRIQNSAIHIPSLCFQTAFESVTAILHQILR